MEVMISSPREPATEHVGMLQRCTRGGLDIRKHLATERLIKSWNSLPSKVVNAPGSSMAKMPLDNDLNNILYLLVGPALVRLLD